MGEVVSLSATAQNGTPLGKYVQVMPPVAPARGADLPEWQALVLLPVKEGEIDDSPVAYRAPLRQALIDDNAGHVNVVVTCTVSPPVHVSDPVGTPSSWPLMGV